MKRIFLQLVAAYHDLLVLAAELRAHDARTVFECAQVELYRAHGWTEIMDERMATARRKADLAYAKVARHDRHRELGIAS